MFSHDSGLGSGRRRGAGPIVGLLLATALMFVGGELAGAATYEWEVRGPSSVRFTDIAVSENGLIAYGVSGPGSGAGEVWKTVDGGMTWQLMTPAYSLQFLSVDTDATGQRVIASGIRSDSSTVRRVVRSVDGGASWSALFNGTSAMGDVSISNDGMVGAIANKRDVSTPGGIYVETTPGAGWTLNGPNLAVSSVAVSGDGTKMYATVTGGKIWRSTSESSFGTWTELTAASAWQWQKIRTSYDGSVVFAAAGEIGNGRQAGTFGAIYSTDDGQTWSTANVADAFGTLQAAEIGLSSDGDTMIAASYSSGATYGVSRISRDGGVTWANGDLFGETSRRWLGFAVSSDGSVIYGATENYGINVLREYGLPSVTLFQPAVGEVAGGTIVTITGQNFTSAATVTFGGVDADIMSRESSTTMTVIIPPHAAGAVDVVVTTASGFATRAGFVYEAPPSQDPPAQDPPASDSSAPTTSPAATTAPSSSTSTTVAAGVESKGSGLVLLVNDTMKLSEVFTASGIKVKTVSTKKYIVSKTSRRHCRVRSGRLRGLAEGRCLVTVRAVPKRGKAISAVVEISVQKKK